MRLYGSRTSIVSRRESWMLKECSDYSRNITATKNRNRARQDAKKEVIEGLAPIDSGNDVELRHESYSEHVRWEDHNADYSCYGCYCFDGCVCDEDEFSFIYCESEWCYACAKELNGNQSFSCIEDQEREHKKYQDKKKEKEDTEAAFIRRIEEALANPIRKTSIEELLAA